MEMFYLNRDFFTNFLNCYYPLGNDFFLIVDSFKVEPVVYKKQYVISVGFCVKFENEFIRCFDGKVILTSRFLRMVSVSYVLDSELARSKFTYFPLSPAWQLSCTNYRIWLHRCFISLSVYRNFGWI